MKRILTISALLAVVLPFIMMVGAALADGGKGVAVKPLTPKPGDEITVKGDLLGPNSEVEVRVMGSGTDIDLGEVQADAEGDFTAQFLLPSDLAPGSYQVKAIGAETASTEIRVVTSAGAEGQAMAAPEVPMRERPLAETAALVGIFGALAGLGLFFARTAKGGEVAS